MKKRKNPLLSVCIPTFNRALALDRLMDSLPSQLAGLSGKVEICVSDNSSENQTSLIVKKWAKKLPLKYKRNTADSGYDRHANLGYDRNVLAALAMAGGDFAWFMSDDDIFERGAIALLVEDIGLAKAGGAGAILANASPIRGKVRDDFGLEKFRLFRKSHAAYPRFTPAFIGSVCVDAKLAKRVVADGILIEAGEAIKAHGDRKVLAGFMHTYLFLECISRSDVFGIEPRPLVRTKADGGQLSYERKLYLDLTLMSFFLDMRLNYDERLSPENFRNCSVMTHIIHLGLVSLRPGLEGPYSAYLEAYTRLLEMEGDTRLAGIVRAFEHVRKNPLSRFLLSVAFIAARRIRKTRIKDEDESELYHGRLSQMMKRTRFLVKNSRAKPG